MAPSLQYFKEASAAKLELYADNKDIFIGDVVTSITDDPQAPITSGFFDVEKGAKSTATFGFSEVKYVISGDIVFSDGNGQRVVAKAGEVVYIPKGATITFESEQGGKAFYVAQRLLNQAKRASFTSRL
ncbi:hypothetical protein LTR84_000636 [Exophiala bonariae]|uniref:(S)-ureidoglycine aminohydrolase cupin domain-containing protein n=1 Tax=Exophiala bonariae TaxID=1690606 RepID=A0AAV9NTW2_9EURO|nr:hypothetical protein LTR84_000636 [Exophiala bonariae]